MSDLYFNNRKLPNPRKEYIAFVDLMGTKNNMRRSVKDTSNFIFKLHAAVISAWRRSAYEGVFVYPIMDGVYITSSNKESLEIIISKIFCDLAALFLKEENPFHQFIPRSGIAYGEIIHGHDVPYQASKVFTLDLQYKNNILLGQAMINAYISEGEAAPFGVYIHESATNRFALKNDAGVILNKWVWYRSSHIKIEDDLSQRLGKALQQYYRTLKDAGHPLHYELEKIQKHENKVKEYFELIDSEN